MTTLAAIVGAFGIFAVLLLLAMVVGSILGGDHVDEGF